MPIEAAFTLDAPVLTIVYADQHNDITRRAVQPLGLIRLKNGSVGLRAMCQMRGALRTFSLRSVQEVLAIDGARFQTGPTAQDGAEWQALAEVVDAPQRRLFAAERFEQWANAAAGPEVDAALAPARAALAEVDKHLSIAIAWKDPDGHARLDLDKDGCAGLHMGSAHQALARRAALRHTASLLWAAAPPDSLYVAWKAGPGLGHAAWSLNGMQWLGLSDSLQAA